MLQSLIYYTGVAALSTLTYKLSRIAYIYLLRNSSLPRYHHGRSPWAIISGSTDGIGFGLAQELCSKNFNVILHGRSETKLAAKRLELLAAFPTIQVKTWLADALSTSQEPFAELEKLLDGLNLTVLVNCIGGTKAALPNGASYQAFVDASPEDIRCMVAYNLGFALQFTRTALPVLLEHEPALIVTIGSHADAGSPYLSTYAGSKAFDMAWSTSLRAEMQAEWKDVEVIGVLSGKAVSASTRGEESLFVPGSRKMGREILGKVGCGRSALSGYWGHAIQRGFLDSLPESWARGLLVNTIKDLWQVEKDDAAKAAKKR